MKKQFQPHRPVWAKMCKEEAEAAKAVLKLLQELKGVDNE